MSLDHNHFPSSCLMPLGPHYHVACMLYRWIWAHSLGPSGYFSLPKIIVSQTHPFISSLDPFQGQLLCVDREVHPLWLLQAGPGAPCQLLPSIHLQPQLHSMSPLGLFC